VFTPAGESTLAGPFFGFSWGVTAIVSLIPPFLLWTLNMDDRRDLVLIGEDLTGSGSLNMVCRLVWVVFWDTSTDDMTDFLQQTCKNKYQYNLHLTVNSYHLNATYKILMDFATMIIFSTQDVIVNENGPLSTATRGSVKTLLTKL
jgi:hypothetical protein